MWVLECEGDLLQYKKQWLCPGETYIIGRGNQANKSLSGGSGKNEMSRKHLSIQVKPVKKGEGLSVHSKSEVLCTDYSKWGTVIDDGESIKNATFTVNKERHTFLLGKCPSKFILSWQPRIFTFSLSKAQRKDPKYIKRFSDKLEKYDIKTIDTFLPEKTTLIVADKRNTSKSLLALVNGLYIVEHTFIDEIVKVCARDPKEPETHSPLEQDFEENWPSPVEFLPKPANEPVKRPPEDFAPNPHRRNMMQGYTVIVSDNLQRDNLLDVVTLAGGKLIFREIKPKVTKAEDYAKFARDTRNSIVVHCTIKGHETWSENFMTKVEKLTGFRNIVQNEFLDAIITINMSALRQPANADGDGDVHMELITEPPAATRSRRRTSAEKPVQVVPESPEGDMEAIDESAPVEAGRRSRSRSSSVEVLIHKPPPKTRTQRSQFTQSKPSQAVSRFDDSDDDFEPLPAPSASMSVAATQQKNGKHVSQVAFVDDEIDAPGEDNTTTQTRGASQRKVSNVSQTASSLRKRRAPPIEEEDEEDEDPDDAYDKLFPGAAAMKKRRLEEEKKAQLAGRSTQLSADVDMEVYEEKGEDHTVPEKKTSARSRKKAAIGEDEVIKAAHEIRRKEEEAEATRRAAAEATRRAAAEAEMQVDGELAGLKNLALVETFELKPRVNKPHRSEAYGDEGSRWDEKWNGRKNFKKFRKRGVNQARTRRAIAPVLVELVEHKARDFGIGDDYWLDNNSKRSKEAELSQPEGNSQYVMPTTQTEPSQIVLSDSDSELEEPLFPTKGSKVQVKKTQTQTQTQNESPTQKNTQRKTQSQAPTTGVSRSTRSGHTAAVTQETPTSTGTRSATGSKRTQQTVATQPKKKQKTSKRGFLAKNEDSDDDSDDELKFKF